VPQTVTARWNDLGLDGKQAVRDVWRHKDLGEFDAEYSVEVGRLGVELIRVCPVN
jgi:alpha-galactosidase